MKLSGNHQEEISLLIIDTSHSPQSGLDKTQDPGVGHLMFQEMPAEGTCSGYRSSVRGGPGPSEGSGGVPRPQRGLL